VVCAALEGVGERAVEAVGCLLRVLDDVDLFAPLLSVAIAEELRATSVKC
jgi:hypothetical protein